MATSNKVARTLRLHGHAGKRILAEGDMHMSQTYRVPWGQIGSDFVNLSVGRHG